MFRSVILSTSRFIRFSCTGCTTNLKTSIAQSNPILPLRNELLQKFHTTHKRNLNPNVVLVLRPLARIASVLSGKAFRNWWKTLTPEKKQYYKKKYFFNPRFWAIPFGVLTIAGGVFYVAHLQTTPITNRNRFILFNNNQLKELCDTQVEQQLKEAEGKIIDPKGDVHIKVWNIVEKLVKSNQDIEQVKSQEWTLHVVDEGTQNAFVLPNGHIFVYTGLLKIANNDDQLAFILGHEMAHAVLSHGAENISFAGIGNIVAAVGLLFIWAILPESLASMVESIQSKILNVLLDMPYNRVLELEADRVGLEFASKACFDVRESSILWRNWAVISAISGEEATPEFLSTHPTNESRARELDKLIPGAVLRRLTCKCPELKGKPSKINFDLLKSFVEETTGNQPATAALTK